VYPFPFVQVSLTPNNEELKARLKSLTVAHIQVIVIQMTKWFTEINRNEIFQKLLSEETVPISCSVYFTSDLKSAVQRAQVRGKGKSQLPLLKLFFSLAFFLDCM
jgi:hypothetical protein